MEDYRLNRITTKHNTEENEDTNIKKIVCDEKRKEEQSKASCNEM